MKKSKELFSYLAVAVLALGSAGFVAAAEEDAAIPTLDELAADWMEVSTLRNFPSVHNFWGALQTHPGLTTFLFAAFPPYANGGDSGVLTINGKPVSATQSRWYPYQVLRRATADGVEMESALRMPFEQRGVLCRLTLKNTTAEPQTLEVSWAFSGQVARAPDQQWRTWSSPHGANGGNTLTVAGEQDKVLCAVSGGGAEPAAVAFAFSNAPDDCKVVTNGGLASWKLTLKPQQTVSLGYSNAMDKDAAGAIRLARGWAKAFDRSFDLAKAQWEERWLAAFTPGNTHFSGHLPTLLTEDPKIRRVYYHGALVPLMLCRTSFPAADRCFVTAGPQWALTLMYFWSLEMWANAWAMLEPATMKPLLSKWLTMNFHNCYALDCLSGEGAGPWYAANDWSIFRCVEAYLEVTGDTAFLKQVLEGKTVLQRLDEIATFYTLRPLTKDSQLADYGVADNLLECSPSYIQGVASLNAANVYMLRRTAGYHEKQGDLKRAKELREKAEKLLPEVLSLYEAGEGVWNARDNKGNKVPIRHCFDYIVTGQALENELTPLIKSEMNRFVETELLTRTWMRAMSLKDPAAAQSDRPDHGPLGSYDAWPAMTMDVLCRSGAFDRALTFLRAAEAVTYEGPFAQSHEFLGPDSRGKDPLIRIANRGGQDYNEGSGAAFTEVIIRSFFGIRPDLPGESLPLLMPKTPRGFDGEMRHVPFRGALYTVKSDVQGVRQNKE